ncbi:hypothetical protein OS347_000761 [Vibrio vulnificus]|nr:hypothetical protein [Vibrio vulnificus]
MFNIKNPRWADSFNSGVIVDVQFRINDNELSEYMPTCILRPRDKKKLNDHDKIFIDIESGKYGEIKPFVVSISDDEMPIITTNEEEISNLKDENAELKKRLAEIEAKLGIN